MPSFYLTCTFRWWSITLYWMLITFGFKVKLKKWTAYTIMCHETLLNAQQIIWYCKYAFHVFFWEFYFLIFLFLFSLWILQTGKGTQMKLCWYEFVCCNFKPIICLRGLLLKVKSNEKREDKIRCSSRAGGLSAFVIFYLVAIWNYAYNLFWPQLPKILQNCCTN